MCLCATMCHYVLLSVAAVSGRHFAPYRPSHRPRPVFPWERHSCVLPKVSAGMPLSRMLLHLLPSSHRLLSLVCFPSSHSLIQPFDSFDLAR
jgi:hypothetical protein